MIDDHDISFVVQGPVRPETEACLASIRDRFPSSRIVLSTWRGQPVSGLPFDRLVENDDPGPLRVRRSGEVVAQENTNRQIASTLAGLRLVTTSYAVKFRSDTVLTGRGFLAYARRLAPASPWQILDERVVACSINTVDPRSFLGFVYHVSDWFHFGRTSDLLRIWDRPLIEDRDDLLDEAVVPDAGFRNGFHFGRYTAEQLVTLGFAADALDIRCAHYRDGSNGNREGTLRFLAANFVLADPRRLGFHFPKYADFCAPRWSSPRSLKRWIGFWSTTIGYRDWRRIAAWAGTEGRTPPRSSLAKRCVRALLWAKNYRGERA